MVNTENETEKEIAPGGTKSPNPHDKISRSEFHDDSETIDLDTFAEILTEEENIYSNWEESIEVNEYVTTFKKRLWGDMPRRS